MNTYTGELSGTKEELEEQITKNDESISACRGFIIKTLILAIIVIFVIYYLMGSFYYVSWVLGIAGVIDLYFLYKISSYKAGKSLIKNAIRNNEVYKQEQERKRNELEKEIKGLNDEILERSVKLRIRDLVMKNAEIAKTIHRYYIAKRIIVLSFPNMERFDEFRKKHYNKDAERFLKRMNIDINEITEEDINSNGTIEDYIDFIEEILNDNYIDIDFELYDIYSDVIFGRNHNLTEYYYKELKDRAILNDIFDIESYRNTKYYKEDNL